MKTILFCLFIVFLSGCSPCTLKVRSIGAYEFSAQIDRNVKPGDSLKIVKKEGESRILSDHVFYTKEVDSFSGVVKDVRCSPYHRTDGQEYGGVAGTVVMDVAVETEKDSFTLSGVIPTKEDEKVSLRCYGRTIGGYFGQSLLLVSVPSDVAISVVMMAFLLTASSK